MYCCCPYYPSFIIKPSKMNFLAPCRCNLVDLMVEMDRILRPEGTVVIRDHPEVIERVNRIARAIRWTATIHEKEPGSQGRERILVATKSFWKLH